MIARARGSFAAVRGASQGARSVLDVSCAQPRSAAALGTAASGALHAAFTGLAILFAGATLRAPQPAALVTEMVQVDLSSPAPPPPIPEPPPSPAPAPRAAARPAAAAPRAAAAQAGKVVAAGEAPVDFGDSWVVGDAASYAGGTTAARGTATHAVRDPGAVANGVDRSSPARLAAGVAWDCPFPREADDAAIDHATVMLRVEVGVDGQVQAARATSPASPGFAREATRCALAKRWTPARDRAGWPIASVANVRVRFDR